MTTLLTIKDLQVHFKLPQQRVKAVDGVSLSIASSEIVGLVGESGSGKTVTAHSILGLVPSPGVIERGSIEWNGTNLVTASAEVLQRVRGKEIAMIFQDPFGSFDPVYTIGDQITEIIMLHQKSARDVAWKKAEEMLAVVKLPDPKRILKSYPHELSGGMCQRAMLALALSCKPQLLIADEPTTALDVTIQAQILDLLRDIQKNFAMSILLITHDLGVVAELCDRVYVMQAGKIVEEGSVFDIFERPQKEYTQKLLQAVPVPDPRRRR